MWTTILTKWRFGLYAVAVIAVIATVVIYRQHVYKLGYNQCTADYTAKMLEAKTEAYSNVSKVEKQHEAAIKKINDQPDNNYTCGPIVDSVIDSL